MKSYRLSEVQKGIYFDCSVENDAGYNVSVCLKVNNADAQVLKNALSVLVAEQPVLRGHIWVDGDMQPCMRIEDNCGADVDCFTGVKEEDLQEHLKEYTGALFDLEKGPLFRVGLTETEKGQIITLVVHHIICDGVSLGIFKKKLFANYDALSAGTPFKIVPDGGFLKFTEKEAARLEKSKYEKKKAYWKEKLNGASASSLTAERDFAKKDAIGKERRFPIPPVLMENIEKASKAGEATEFMYCLAAYAALIYKYTGNEDFVVASPFTHRPDISLEDTIGCFIYTYPLRYRISADTSFNDLLRMTKEEVIGAYKNIGYPNNLIARDNGLIPAPGSPGVFDLSFVYDVYDEESEGAILKSEFFDTDHVPFAGVMMAAFSKLPDSAVFRIQYGADVFDDEAVEKMGGRFIKILEAAVSGPGAKIDDMSIFLDGEEEKLIRGINQTSYFDYTPSSVTEIFKKKAAQHASNIAVYYGDFALTYEELDKKTDTAAKKILSMNPKGDIIGIQMERSVEYIIALFGILKAGKAYVPIDPGYPESRKEFIYADAAVDLLITDQMPPDTAPVRALSPGELCQGGDVCLESVQYNPENLIYVEYTSGSTGPPKGVMIKHRSLVNTLLDLERRFPVDSGDVYLLKTPFTFDIAGTELFGFFMGNGGALCVLEKYHEKDTVKILRAIDRFKVTHINFVPSMLNLFLETAKDFDPGTLSSLKWVFTGGEAVSQDIARKYFDLGINASLHNLYGPTECSMWASHSELSAGGDITLGTPLNFTRWYIRDKNGGLSPEGIPGELCLSSEGLSPGYLNRPDLNEKFFVSNPFYDYNSDPECFKMLYRTGDLARTTPDGQIEFLGRIDFQVKIGGIRMELGEIEDALESQSGVVQAAVVLKEERKVLCAYYLSKEALDESLLKQRMSELLPPYMIPSFFVKMDEFPKTSSGKLDRKSLANDTEYLKNAPQSGGSANMSELESRIAQIWEKILSTDAAGPDTNFFDAGGNSISLIILSNNLRKEFNIDFSVARLFQYPTIRLMAEYISAGRESKITERGNYFQRTEIFNRPDIAIIGASVAAPGAGDIAEFWNILKNGDETIHFYTDEELLDLGVPKEILSMPSYVKAKGRVDGTDDFDPVFFDSSPAEIKITSPQLRLLYKGIWNAFEDASCYPDSIDGKTGIFLGGSDDFGWYRKVLYGDADFSDKYQAFTMSTNHFLSTRLAYKFNIKGPVLSVLTACSTTLTAVHVACQSLVLGECDMAVAGGVTVELPNEGGYFHEEGMMFSSDGHCRPFDNKADGTVFSNGMGMVVLKRLEDAVRQGDNIYAVIKGSAVNNDGSLKAGYAAPSVEGQKDVIQSAYKAAGVDPETVSYVEAHGTGTALGDPIEVESLTQAFATDKTGFCTLGSVKGNIGHTDTAAGVVGLIKAALCLKNKFIPGTVNFREPNSKIDFSKTPFHVSPEGKPWETENGLIRRAGINSFGIGGTNSHVVLEEYEENPESPAEESNILVFSAKSAGALDETAGKVVEYIGVNPSVNVSDAAWTLQTGRKEFPFRKAVWAGADIRQNLKEYIARLETAPVTECSGNENVYFLFSGQGSQYQGMSRGLTQSGSVFGRKYKSYVDSVLELVDGGEEYRAVLFGDTEPLRINNTQYAQVCLFAVEYAFAKTLIDFGIAPKALLGHSIGELAAAAVAGVWKLEDAVMIVQERGKIMQKQPTGVMLAISASANEISELLPENTYVSLYNTTERCVAGGAESGVAHLEKRLAQKGVQFSRIQTSHAFHTPMMFEAAQEFKEFLAGFCFNAPGYPILSNVTGAYLTDNEARSPEYWAKHIVSPVDFEKCLEMILEDETGVYVELGAGRTACMLAQKHSAKKKTQKFVNMLRHPKEDISDEAYCHEKLAGIWCAGGSINWQAFYNEQRKRVSVPGYVYEKHPYPIKVPLDPSESVIYDEPSVFTSNEAGMLKQIGSGDALPIVLKAYQGVFGFDNIDENADFFALGGDSLVAVSLAGNLKKMLGVKIEVTSVFNFPSPRGLAENIEKSGALAEAPGLIPKAPAADFYPVSSPQQRMYTLYMLDPQNIAYNLPSATVLHGNLDSLRAEEALKKLVNRHESLRTSFKMVNGQVVQVIHDDVCPVFEYSKAFIKTQEDIDEVIKSFVRPFDLSAAPLFRIGLVDCGDGRSVLLFDVHHIIADGTGVEILTRDFSALYTGDMPEPAFQYKDYSVWQKRHMSSPEALVEKEYWLSRFAGNIPVLEMPADFNRPLIKNFNGGRFSFNVPAGISQKLADISKNSGATMYMTLLSAWFVMLSRYSGQEDIVVGTPVAGRSRPEFEDMVGMFINMLPMRNFPSGNKKFSDFLSDVKENTMSAFAHQNYQFSDMVDGLNIERSLNRNAIFDVCFDFQNMKLYELDVDGIKIEPYEFDAGVSAYDLVMTCRQREDGGLEGFLDYSRGLYGEDTARRLAGHFIKIMEEVTENPNILIKDIGIITEEETRWLAGIVNATDASFEENTPVNVLFERNAEKHPHKVALITPDNKTFTYNELNILSNRLARKLKDCGINDGDIAAVMPGRDEYLFISILAVLKAGGAYLPVDPALPPDRISYMLGQDGVKFLLAAPEYSDEFASSGLITVNPASCGGAYGEDNLTGHFGKTAYVVFTSGTTGRPKGVMIEHESVVNFIHDCQSRKLFKNPEDRIISVTTPSFDIFVFESLVPLCTGFSICLASGEEQLDPALAAARIMQYGVTHILSTVSRIKAFVEHPEFMPALKSLKCVLSGGENYPMQMLEYLRKNTDADIYNMYGPSETTVWSTVKKLNDAAAISIGSPVCNTGIHILSPSGKIQPVGVFGELCISGKGLSKGYLNNDEETEKRFVTIEGKRVYKTGDRARILQNGEVELLGRLDNQVKIRGYRVETAEIEKAAMQNNKVKQAAVKVFRDSNGDNGLAVFYTVFNPLADRELKTHLEDVLPRYMVPSRYVCRDELPTLPNGKININALEIPAAGAAPVQPETLGMITGSGMNGSQRGGALLNRVLEIMRDALGNPDMSAFDNFFDAGGNSLSLMNANNRINALLGYNFPLTRLFEYPTVSGLVSSIGGAEEELADVTESAYARPGLQDIAVIGISCNFPGADGADEFWNNIMSGKESVCGITDEALEKSGIPEELYTRPDYIKRKGLVSGAEYFDGKFFGYSSKESDIMDPQMRMLHQNVWRALEDGGCNPFNYPGRIGIFAGSSANVMWLSQFFSQYNDGLSAYETITLNEKDFLTSQISYKLNLRGPSVNIQSACSTSLVAVHYAAESIRRGESDMALAGGVSISYPQNEGYLWNKGMIFSKDGHCKVFSADSSGTVIGNGCGVVLLKPYEKAKADGDRIYALIRGTAVNNDGSGKAGYTAPGVWGQAEVIKKALVNSGLSAEDMDYIESHGTGTELGDPIEISALKKAFNTEKMNYCALGAVKANIGHLDAAAGVAGFIKTALVLHNKTLPPLVHYDGKPNPHIDFENSPFYIPEQCQAIDKQQPAAGVSSFGIGGVNAHIIMSGVPDVREDVKKTVRKEDASYGKPVLMMFSAKSESALRNTAEKVMAYLADNPGVSLDDAAYTLRKRSLFPFRKAFVVTGRGDFGKIDLTIPSATGEKTVNLHFGGGDIRISNPDSQELIIRKYWKYAEQALNVTEAEESHKIRIYLTLGAAGPHMSHELLQLAKFVSGYAVYNVLKESGVTFNEVNGSGTGQVTASAVTGRITLEEAVSAIRGKGFENPGDLGDEKHRPEPGNTFTLEIGKDAVCADALYEAFAGLWQAGHDFDAEIFNNSQPRHVSLPTYIFDKEFHKADVCLKDAAPRLGEASRPVVTARHVITEESVAKEVCEIFTEVFGCAVLGSDNFFKLGGESLNALQVCNKVGMRLGAEIGVEHIFNNPGISELSAVIFASAGTVRENHIPLLEKRASYELSAAQKRMYAANELQGGSVSYNLASACILEGDLDKERLVSVFERLINRHEAFRTRFDFENGEIVQIIRDRVQPDEFFQYAETTEDLIEKRLEDFIRPFDLAKAPLIRVLILKISDRKHVLAMDMHHIIADQTSIAILMDEFGNMYSGGEPPELGIQFKDFAAWQNKRLSDGTADIQIEFWKREFAEGVPLLELSTDYPRPAFQSYEGGRIQTEFGGGIVSGIKRLAGENGVTPYTVLLAALSVLLSKYSGQDEIVVGTGLAGRNHDDLKGVVGMFVNTLPVLCRPGPEMTVSEYLAFLKKKTAEVFDNQECQFEVLADILNVKKDLSRNPVFDVMFNYVNMGTEEFEIEGLKLYSLESEKIDTKYDLNFTVEENKNRFKISLEFSTALFKRQTALDMLRRLEHIIGVLTESGGTKLSGISLTDEEDCSVINQYARGCVSDCAKDRTILDLFRESVSLYPDNPAVRFGEKVLSYAELDAESNRLANKIAPKVKNGNYAVLLLDKSAKQIIAMLAVMKLGAAYVPVSPSEPDSRLSYILRDSGAALVITEEKYTGRITGVECVTAENSLYPDAHPGRAVSPDDICYVIYTSGSTGNPKGVKVMHQCVPRVVKEPGYITIQPNDNVLQLSNYAFDGSVFDIYGAILNGACLIIAPQEITLEMSELTAFIETSRISVFFTTTMLFNMMADWNVDALKNVRHIIFGGETASAHHVRKAFDALGPGRLIHAYGPTETTVFALCGVINEYPQGESVSIGRPIANTSAYVVDNRGRVLPHGVPGELYIGGCGVAAGYLNREELTEERFVDLSFEPGSRFYRTGDIVKMCRDGTFEYIGRRDFQIKLRGFRIEPGEIEQKITEIDGVDYAAVLALKDDTGDLYISAYYTARAGGPDEASVRNSLKTVLPDYMVPARILRLESMPLNSNGKADRSRLADMPLTPVQAGGSGGNFADAEQAALDAMRKAIGTNDLNPEDNFFAFGGQSIKAITAARHLREIGVDIKINDIFMHPSAKALAALPAFDVLRTQEAVESEERLEPVTEPVKETLEAKEHTDAMALVITAKAATLSRTLESLPIKKSFPPSPVQKAQAALPPLPSGFIGVIKNAPSEKEVLECFARLIIDHQLLHSTRGPSGEWKERDTGGYLQVIANSVSYTDLSSFTPESVASVLACVYEKILYDNYNPGEFPHRLCCVRTDRKTVQYVWGFDHSAFDGMSAEILKRGVEEGLLGGPERETPQKYEEYAAVAVRRPDIEPSDIVREFMLEEWGSANIELLRRIEALGSGCTDNSFNLAIPLSGLDGHDIWDSAFNIAAGILERYTGMEKLPSLIVDYGREYRGERFYNCVGEFLDLIPVFMGDTKRAERLIALCKQNGLNFLSLLYDGMLRKNMAPAVGLLDPFLVKFDNVPGAVLYNFQGYIQQHEKNAFSTLAARPGVVAAATVSVNFDNEFLYIEIELESGINVEMMEEISVNLKDISINKEVSV